MTTDQPTALPVHGTPAAEILAEIADMRSRDIDWRGGRAFSLVYNADDAELVDLQHRVGADFLHENALNPFRYESLLRMETELISMGTQLFGANSGTLSSGGTESIFLAVQTARDAAAARGVTEPRLICTDTAHPAFAKACHYLGVQRVACPHRSDGRADPDAYAAAIDERTALVVVSSPCYPYGVIDPIEEIAALALERGVLCHVDACLGGWLLPWWERLGRPVPAWDFRVPGVTSLSADVHKYGYAFKGVSMVMYATRELYQRQIFMFDDWPGGLYASSTAAGTRSGAPIAGAWAVLKHLGEDGYLRLAARVAAATDAFVAGIGAIDGVDITHEPDLSIMEVGSDTVDMNAVCDVMDEKGWNLDRQNAGLHLMLAPGHDKVADDFCADLADAVANHGAASGAAAIYGGVVDADTMR